jgi:hypothetical protein
MVSTDAGAAQRIELTGAALFAASEWSTVLGADLLNVLMLMQHPSARMPFKAEMGIVVQCRRSRKQDQLALRAQAIFRETNKLLPYTSPLY